MVAKGSVRVCLGWSRALASRQVGEYVPWQVAAPILVRIKDLLELETSRSGSACADRFKAYVLQNITTPYLAMLEAQGTGDRFRCVLPLPKGNVAMLHCSARPCPGMLTVNGSC